MVSSDMFTLFEYVANIVSEITIKRYGQSIKYEIIQKLIENETEIKNLIEKNKNDVKKTSNAPPKKPLNGFMLFCRDKRVTGKFTCKELGALWREMKKATEGKKKDDYIYYSETLVNEEIRRYQEQMKQYCPEDLHEEKPKKKRTKPRIPYDFFLLEKGVEDSEEMFREFLQESEENNSWHSKSFRDLQRYERELVEEKINGRSAYVIYAFRKRFIINAKYQEDVLKYKYGLLEDSISEPIKKSAEEVRVEVSKGWKELKSDKNFYTEYLQLEKIEKELAEEIRNKKI